MRAGPLRPIARRALAAQSDERLVGLVREGHEPAFEEIVRRYRGPLVAFATAIVSHHRAEDVVQASLERAHRALLGGGAEISLRPWLFAIVRNGSLNVIRDEPVASELGPELAGGVPLDEVAEQRDELDRLVMAICALPRAQREALVRREIDGAGHAEIAAQLGTSATAVRGLIFRARTTLRDAVGLLVPLPLLRLLLGNASPAGAATAGAAGAGAGATLLGAAGAKGGLAVAAAVAALAAGVAIKSDSTAETPERADAAQSGAEERPPERGDSRVSEPAEPRIDGRGEDSSGHGSGDSGSGRSGSGDGSDDDNSGPGNGGDDDDGDDDNSGSGSDDGPDGGGGDDNSGSGSGGDDGGDDSSGSGSGDDDDVDNSGPGSYDGSDDGDNSGPGGGGDDADDDDLPLPPPPPDDSSGPGDGSLEEDDGDNSGSGGGGSNSGSGSDDD